MKISAVVLDMDGLMLDTEPLYKAAWQQASSDVGFNLDDVTYSKLIGRSTEECESELTQHFGPHFPISTFGIRWPELWRTSVQKKGIPLKAGLLNLLSFLEARRLPYAIATSSDADYTAFSLRSAGLSDRCHLVVTRDQVARGKPAPDIHIEAARRLGQVPADCVALEDSDAGVLAASAAGMLTLCVPDLKAPSRAATQAAFRTLGSLDEARDLIAGVLMNGRASG